MCVPFLCAHELTDGTYINPFTYAVENGEQYTYENNYKRIYEYPRFFNLGWSKDGKYAYCIERGVSGAGGAEVAYYIQDVVTDEIIWSYTDSTFVGGEKSYSMEYILDKSIHNNYALIQKKLSQNAIALVTNAYKRLPIKIGDDEIAFKIEITDAGQDEFGFRMIDYMCKAVKNKKLTKTISQKKHVTADDVYICGYIQSPFENRIALILAEERYVFEGNELFYFVAGCDLVKGF